MKAMNKVVFGAVLTAVVALGAPAYADEIYASPKAKAFLTSLGRTSVAGGDMIDRSVKPLSPRLAATLAEKGGTAPACGDHIDRTVKPVSPRALANMAK